MLILTLNIYETLFILLFILYYMISKDLLLFNYDNLLNNNMNRLFVSKYSIINYFIRNIIIIIGFLIYIPKIRLKLNNYIQYKKDVEELIFINSVYKDMSNDYMKKRKKILQRKLFIKKKIKQSKKIFNFN